MERIPPLDCRTRATLAATIAVGLFIFGAGGANSQVRLMPLGDSITEGVLGSSDDTGYRRALYQSLTTAGYSVNFVGSRANGIPTDFDRDHEGHSGWRADQIRDGISGWLTTNPADIILLHIGTNDFSQGQNVSSTLDEVNQILDRIDAKSTATVVFLARIINRNDGYSDSTTTYNVQLKGLADRRIANGDLIIVVDQESALNYPSDLADHVHPNDAGYAKMAQCWFTPLSDYLATLPIQLSSFTGKLITEGSVRLEWTTLTETNNYGFEIQRSSNGSDGYQTLPNSFISGHGTTLLPQKYMYVDSAVTPGPWYYRLKQIDLDGTVHYLDSIRLHKLPSVSDVVPSEFSLLQNYPNPFNPSTNIKYELRKSSEVRLSVYDLLGREVSMLVNEKRDAGVHEVKLDGTTLASGVYFYRLQVRPLDSATGRDSKSGVGDFVQTRKLLLLR